MEKIERASMCVCVKEREGNKETDKQMEKIKRESVPVVVVRETGKRVPAP